MKFKQNKSGFTLLEIIIVIIIVGVLASLAMPRFFATVEFSKSAEALNAMGVLRGAMERCFVASGATYTPASGNCGIGTIDVEDPGATPGARFSYAITGQGVDTYVITATRNMLDGGDGVSTIVLTVDDTPTPPNPPVVRSGTGKFVGIK